jgi:hypothetical protein
MKQIVHGVIHGRTIELDQDLGLADGEAVTVTITSKAVSEAGSHARQSGDGIRRSAGAWAEFPEMDAIMEDIQRERARSIPREVG